MTPDEIRVAVAEACGWHCCGPYTVGRSGNQRTVYKGIHPQTSKQRELPDYPNDLNAICAAVETLNNYQLQKYGELLQEIVNYYCVGIVPDYPRHLMCLAKISNATALQRCEAFLKTLNQWRE